MSGLLRRLSHERRLLIPKLRNSLRFNQDFTQLNLKAAACIGPTLTMVRDTQALYSPAQSPGQIQLAPHQEIENATLGTRTGTLPSGWLWPTETGTATWEDHADGYSVGTFTVSGTRQVLQENYTQAQGVGTLVCYIESCNITSGDPIILRADVNAGTDADISDTDFDTLGGNAGWYAVAFEETGVGFNYFMGPGSTASATGSCVLSRPAILFGNSLGVGLNTPVYLGTTAPLGAWVGTDDGDEPKYDQARLAAGVYDGSPLNEQVWSEEFDNAVWATTNSTVTGNQVANPLNGDITADELDMGTSAGAHIVADAFVQSE